jgi:hypothetical protein
MMQGIWTSRSGSRIKATAYTRNSWGDGEPELSLALARDWSLDIAEEHALAAAALARRQGWDGLWHGGGRPDNKGYMFVKIASAYAGAPDTSIGREGIDWFYIKEEELA